MRFLSSQVPEFPKIISDYCQRFSETFEDILKNSEVLKVHNAFGMRFKNNPLGFFP